jgi:hypothetical protein
MQMAGKTGSGAVGQRVGCKTVSDAKYAQMERLHIPEPAAITEYMTAVELAQAGQRALHCEFRPAELIQDLNRGIAWRITKFAQNHPHYNKLFIEYVGSSGQDTIDTNIALKWLRHNNLVAQFNAWDAADVKHNYHVLAVNCRIDGQRIVPYRMIANLGFRLQTIKAKINRNTLRGRSVQMIFIPSKPALRPVPWHATVPTPFVSSTLWAAKILISAVYCLQAAEAFYSRKPLPSFSPPVER